MLFPNAMAVPGPQHIIDNVAELGVAKLSYWDSWEPSAKVLCQWLNPVNNRRWLKKQVRLAGGDRWKERLASLASGCDRFAQWRWKTLGHVTLDLMRLEDAFRSGIARVRSASGIGGRCAESASKLWHLAHDDAFWAQTARLHRLIYPLMQLASWVRGCDCHEVERLAGKRATCDWQGCRAASLASKVRQTSDDLEAVRYGCVRDGYHEESLAVTGMLASFREKFAWLEQDPYTIWRAHDRQVAAGILSRRDSMVSEGQQPHRVIELFVGTCDGSLRADVEAFVQGSDASARLRQELVSYQLARIDDTWCEAVHRDVTALCRRMSNASVGYVAGSLRAEQNLASLASKTDEEQAFFYKAVTHFRAIGNKHAARSLAAVPPAYGNTASVVSMVYRHDATTLRNWTRELGKNRLQMMVRKGANVRDAVHRLQVEYVENVSLLVLL